MKRVVLDTNVVVSGLLFGGRPGELISLWKERRIVPLCSKPIVEEILRVLAYPKFQLSDQEIQAVLYQEILPWFEIVQSESGRAYVQADPDDDKFIHCALSGRADCIISGDAHLLALRNPPVPVLTVQGFLGALQERAPNSP